MFSRLPVLTLLGLGFVISQPVRGQARFQVLDFAPRHVYLAARGESRRAGRVWNQRCSFFRR